jgi:acetylornithine deacetylase/succinyl-diaminopimelate desuccinylase-like protein
MNAAHVLNEMLAAVLPGPDGKLRDELRAGLVGPTEHERQAWAKLPPAAELLTQVGANPIHPGSAATYYEQTWADASIDINGIAAGDSVHLRTIIPAVATAKLSMRLAPDQTAAAMGAELERLLRDAAPPGVEVTISWVEPGTNPTALDPTEPALMLAIAALGEACGKAPVLIRSGGSIPVVAAFAEKGIPAILSGSGRGDDNAHAPDESFGFESLRLGEASARALYKHLAKLT